VGNLLKALELYIFPKHCLVCGVNENYICNFCEGEIRNVLTYHCVICGKPCLNGFIHINCANKYTPDRFLAAFEYKGVVKRALINAKYKRKIFDVYNLLVDLACEYFKGINLEIGDKAVMVPVPVSYKKYKKRTFDHSLIISELFAKKYNVKVVPVLIKHKDTVSQSLLSREEREKNVKGVFKVNPGLISQIKGKDVVVIDDIVTTGATMLSACGELRKLGKNGPRYIYCVSLAYDVLRTV